MSMVGVTVISILSGFGMANTPLTTWYQPDVSEQDCGAAERALAQTDKMIQEKKAVLDKMKRERPQSPTSVGRLVSSFFGQGKDQERILLQTEVEQLEALAVNMKEDLEELERGRVSIRQTKSSIPEHLFLRQEVDMLKHGKEKYGSGLVRDLLSIVCIDLVW